MRALRLAPALLLLLACGVERSAPAGGPALEPPESAAEGASEPPPEPPSSPWTP